MTFFNQAGIRYLTFVMMLVGILSCRTKNKAVQTQTSTLDTLENSLIWISMIDSPGVNYYKAVEAFDKYWANRQKPTEDDGEGKDIYSKENEEREKKEDEAIPYVYEYKRFLNWQQRNKNLVKPDGTIMTPEEVLEQWKKLHNDSLKR